MADTPAAPTELPRDEPLAALPDQAGVAVALRGNELRFRRLIEKLPVAAYTCDLDGLITYFNDRAERLWGRAPKLHHLDDRFCGSFRIFGADGAPIAHEDSWMARSLRDGREHFGEEVWIERPDGTRVAALAHASPLRDDAGRLVGSLNILVDVTDRRRAEAMLRGSEERFIRFMQHLPGLAWIKDHAGRYLFVNDAAEAAFRKPRSEVYGRTDDEIFPPETSAQFRENDEKALRSGTSIETIETLEHADGVHQSLVSKFPIPGPDGAPSLVGGIAIDITARLSAEEAVRETEARFRDMADHAPVLIWMLSPSGCEFVNRETLRFLGCGIEDVQGWGWRRFIHPDDARAYMAEYARCVAEQRPFEAQARFRRADGEYRWFRSSGVPRRQADGAALRYVGCSVDITEIKRSEDALLEADRRKDEFLATLAHELRNPLAPIRSSLQLLRESSDAPGELCAMLERQVDQMVRLVDDLLEISRMTQGRIELRREPALLSSVLQAALETARPAIEAGRHRLELSLPREPLSVDADPLRLAQVFVNLLDNAAKYTPDGGCIELRTQRRGGEVEISVRDDGVGIPDAVLPRVFEPFTRAPHALPRAKGGLGIGLALVARLVELHGGRVEARSDGPGRGSEFAVRLPLRAGPAVPRIETDRPAASAIAGSPQRVLVVDDNRDAAESLAMLLRKRGVEALVAHDGESALEAARARVPTAVLLDLGMPGMDGYEVARQLRAQPSAQEALLVALTGWGQPDVQSRCEAAGFDHHLVKPVRIETLEALLALPPQRPKAHP
ncbi:MAG TPA: PAS domain S-box protein [Myxococcota bacterium]|nr:PAS domain S-box protein [Myxococcota bacterium]